MRWVAANLTNMPNRYIRASAIESEAVNALTPSAEVFWRRLLNRVDDFGRFTANPSLLRATLYPLQLSKVSEKVIALNLKACADVGLLFMYEINGKQLLVMNKWEKGRAHKSDYDAPPPTVCEQMQTYVYRCKHKPTAAPDSDSDSDSDNRRALPFVSLPFSSAWADFCQHRTEIKKKLTPKATDGALSMLAKMGEARAIAALRHTIASGWQGIREPEAGKIGSVRATVSNPWDQEPEGWRAYWRNKYPPEDFPDAVRHDEKQWSELSSYDRKLIYQGMNSTRREIQLESQ